MIDTVHLTLPTLIAQADPGSQVGTGTGLVGGAVGAFLTTLIVGGILVTLVPGFTERTMAVVNDNPVGSFVYGIVVLVVIIVAAVVLTLTVIGILVAVPLLLVAYLLWAVGAAIGFIAIGDRLVGREGGWLKPLVVGAVINGVLAVTGIGGLVSFAVGATGFGAVMRSLLD